MKQIISFSISLVSVICFALAFVLPTSGENRAAVAILAMVTLIGNQIVAILPHTRINLATIPTKDHAEKAAIWIGFTTLSLAGFQNVAYQMPQAWGWILLAGVFSCLFAGLVILFWAIPAAQNSYYKYIGEQRQNIYNTLVAPLEEQQRTLKHLDEVQRELELINPLNEWELQNH